MGTNGKNKKIIKSLGVLVIAGVTGFMFVFMLAATGSGLGAPGGQDKIALQIGVYLIAALGILSVPLHLFGQYLLWSDKGNVIKKYTDVFLYIGPIFMGALYGGAIAYAIILKLLEFLA